MKEKKFTGYASIDKPQNIGYSFFKQHPIIPNMDIYNCIKFLNTFYKEKKAIDCLDLSVNYEMLIKDAVVISKALKELGIKKGQIISISMPNFYQAVVSFLACNRIGAIATFLNPVASFEEIADYLNLFESPILINYDKTEEENLKYRKNTNVKYIITLNKENVCNVSLNSSCNLNKNEHLINFNGLEQLAYFQKKGIFINSSKTDALILFTSGTTGKPKSVVLTNENIIAAGTYLKNSSRIKSLNGNSTLVCVPFMYPYGFATSTLMTLMSSKTAILAPNMSKDTISYYLQKNPNIIFGSPALLDLIMKNIPDNQDLSSIKTYISGGDFLSPSHAKRGLAFFKKHGAINVEIGNGSGNAETVSCGTNPVGIEIRPETAGKILVGTDAMIVDPDTMEEKKYNEEGLLCVSGKHVFKQYYKDIDKTNDAKFERNGKVYFKTGTMGFIDKQGYFTVTGRQSRFYIISTLNKVYCDHIQSIICDINYIEDCAIVKVPDDDMLYVNKAYIVLRKPIDEQIKEKLIEDLRNPIENSKHESKQLKWYEIPKYIEFVDELPRKQGTEKIDYSYLEQDAINKLEEGRQKVKSIK